MPENLIATSVHSDHGTVVLFDCTDEDTGREYVVAVDHRPARDLAELIAREGACPIAGVEPWQIRGAR